MTEKADIKPAEDMARGVSRRAFIKGVITSGVAALPPIICFAPPLY